MLKGKKRPENHVIGAEAVDILKSIFPKYWVVREYNPDYGIDLSVELFEPYEDGYITCGEYIYFQVKGTKNITIKKKKIYSWDKKSFNEMEVVKFALETSLLELVEKMGNAVPVILALILY